MYKIVIIHFLPLEYYPPATNFLDYISNANSVNCFVFSSQNSQNRTDYSNNNIKIRRYKSYEELKNSFSRLITYFWFNISVFFNLLRINPDTVLYYESYSALPVFWYFKWFGKNKKLWMHSHEYFAPEWYKNGMKSVREYHKREIKFLYPRANGLSMTNLHRIKLFLKDFPFILENNMHALPNFPPISWSKESRKIEKIKTPLKTVYIGSISLRATYIKEYCDWVIQQKGKIIFDIYAFPIDNQTLKYLKSLPEKLFNIFNNGINYKNIPETIKNKNYDVGLILYKGLYSNTVYCASNKLFEYLACGLDVWLTDKMIGSFEYLTKETYPKVIKINYEKLDDYLLEELVDHEELTYRPSEYYCEAIYEGFLEKLMANN